MSDLTDNGPGSVENCRVEVQAVLDKFGCTLITETIPTLRLRPGGRWELETETAIKVVRRGT